MFSWDTIHRARRAVTVLAAAALLGLVAPARSAAAPPPAEKVDYNFHIRPLLADRCFICHGPDEKSRKARLRLDDPRVARARGAIVPGKLEESGLIERI